MSQATHASNSEVLEKELNKTDLGHILYENRKVFLAALVAVIVVVMGYVFWKNQKENTALAHAEQVFKFQNETWSEAKAGKLAPAELVKKFEALDKTVQTAPIMATLVLEMSKTFYDKGSFQESDALLSKVADVKHPITAFFVSMQRAVVLEKLGKIEEAIGQLETLNKAKDKVMPARVSLELGRLYLLKGDKGAAQTQFTSIVSDFPNDEQAKLAKLYLSQIAK